MSLLVRMLAICIFLPLLHADEKNIDISSIIGKENLAFILLSKKGCTECEKAEKIWKDFKSIFEGYVSFEVLNAESGIPDAYKTLTFPAIKIYTKETKKVTDYKKPIIAEDIFSFAQNHIIVSLKSAYRKKGYSFRDTYVISLGDKNFTENVENSEDHHLVEFFAPWCGHCKALKPAYEEAAKKLHGKIKLVAVDCTVNEELARKFGVKGFPTIKFIPAKSKNILNVIDYNGGRTSNDIVTWVETLISSMAPPPELIHVTSQSELDSECFAKGLCLISFLPNRRDSDAATWKKYIATLQEAVDGTKTRNFGWVWLEGAVHNDFEASLGVGDFGYPAVLAVNFQKKVFSTMKSSFSPGSIKKFVDSLGSRTIITSTLPDNIPAIKEQAKWDGSEL